MKIKIKQIDLMQGINIVQKAIPSRSVMPILKGILLTANQSSIELVANDLQIGIETNVVAEVIESGSVVIDSKLLSDLVRNIKEEYIEISVNENFLVNIKSNNLDINLQGFSGIDFPDLPSVREENVITLVEKTLLEMINQTIFAIANTEYLQVINGQLIEVKDDEIIMVSTDSYRFARRKQSYNNYKNIETSIVIPGDSLKEIRKLLKADSLNNVKIIFEENHALFVIGDIKVVTRLLQGKFIKHEMIIPRNFETEIFLKSKDLLEALEITSVFAEKVNSSVAFNIKDNVLEVFSNTEIGNISKNIDIELRGSELEIAFNIRYLMEGLKAISDENIVFSFVKGSRSPGVIRPASNTEYEYLISPVLMNKIN